MKKPTITKQMLRRAILPAIIIAQFIILIILAGYLYTMQWQFREWSTDKIANQIVLAVDNLVKDTNIDAQTGRVYVYESKITLPPAPNRTYDLKYYYLPAIQNNSQEAKAELNLIDNQSYMMAKSKIYNALDVNQVFQAVPKLQACARGYLVVFEIIQQYQTEKTLVFSKKLKDGRTAFVYVDNNCAESKNRMTSYLKQIESY